VRDSILKGAPEHNTDWLKLCLSQLAFALLLEIYRYFLLTDAALWCRPEIEDRVNPITISIQAITFRTGNFPEEGIKSRCLLNNFPRE
jgi:hypothetical protein